MTGLILGPMLFAAIWMMDLNPGKPEVTRMAAIAALMAVMWVTETIPMAATALIPVVLYPLMGIMKGKAAAGVYFNSTIFLFMGGFLIALAMEKWNLHKRIALLTVKTIGGGPSRIVFGFMAASAFLSMWISNTATAVMMLPIALSIVYKMEEQFSAEDTRSFTLPLLLGIAYAASMGGAATLVGTPPNLVLTRTFEQLFPTAPPISFGTWMLMALPLSLAMLAVIWFLLTQVFYRTPSHVKVDHSVVEQEYKDLGPITSEERKVLMVFIATALLWIFRKDLNIGNCHSSRMGIAAPLSGADRRRYRCRHHVHVSLFYAHHKRRCRECNPFGLNGLLQAPLGNHPPFWRWFCFGQRLSVFRPIGIHRKQASNPGRHQLHRHDLRHLHHLDIFD